MQSASVPSSPCRRTRSAYTGASTLPASDSPVSSPTHSPPRQRLRRVIESYSEESEKEPEEESEPEEDPEEEPLPTEPTPADHAPESTGGQRDGKQVIEEVQRAFELGQSSRDAQIQEGDPETPLGLGMRAAMLRIREEQEDARKGLEEDTDSEEWKDIECVPRADSPDYVPSSPSFVPPPSPGISPPVSPAASSLPPDSPVHDNGITAVEQVFIRLGEHASLLEAHTEQIGRLEQTDRILRIDRRIDIMDRAASVLFEDAIADRRERADLRARFDGLARTHSRELWELESRFHGMGRGQARFHGRLTDTERDLEVAQFTIQAQGQRIISLESMLGAQLMINQEYRGRFEQLEATQKELVAGMERLRLERDRA